MATVNREDFLRRLQSVECGLAKRDLIEQSACYVLRAGLVHTYNDFMCCRCPSGLPDDFEGAVAAKPLTEQLIRWEEDEIDVVLGEEGLVLSGLSRGTIRWTRQSLVRAEADIALPIDSVPMPEEGEWQVLHEDFCEAVQTVGLCSSQEASHFYRTCVHIHPDWVESSDDFQVARWVLKTGLSESFLLRQADIKHVASLGMAEFAESEHWLHFRNPSGLVLSCRRYQEEYPDFSDSFEVEGETVQFPKGLEEACDKARVFTEEDAKDGGLVQVDLRSGKLVLKGAGALGWYKERKKVIYSGKPLRFLVSPVLLADLVKRHQQCVVSATKMKVSGGKYTWVAALNEPDDDGNGEAPKKVRKASKHDEDSK